MHAGIRFWNNPLINQKRPNSHMTSTHSYSIDLLTKHYFVFLYLGVGYNVLSHVFKSKTQSALVLFTLACKCLHLFGNHIRCFQRLRGARVCFVPANWLAANKLFNSIMIGALHIFHLVMYWKDITRDDLFHHLLFVTFNQCAQFYPILSGWKVYQWGSALNAINFFACGLPGGLDYFFLGLTKIGKMQRLTHKRLQAVINVWLRCPGIFSSVSISLFESYRNYKNVPFSGVVIAHVCFVLIGYNAIHYMERVVLSAGGT